MNFKKWENDPVERQHTQFYKHFLGLNRRAPNVVARNETGRLSLKLNILLRIIKFKDRVSQGHEDYVMEGARVRF